MLAWVVSTGVADLLVVVPSPGTAQVEYDAAGNDHMLPVRDLQGGDGVVVVHRSATATKDRLLLLAGNGAPTDVRYLGPVAELLCGYKECG